jgi:hypothetical protein
VWKRTTPGTQCDYSFLDYCGLHLRLTFTCNVVFEVFTIEQIGKPVSILSMDLTADGPSLSVEWMTRCSLEYVDHRVRKQSYKIVVQGWD